MKGILIAAAVGLFVSIMFTPYLIRLFSRQGFGQEIREEGPKAHAAKRGTPTMGGVAIVVAMWAGYVVAHLVNAVGATPNPPTASGILVLLLTTSLGLVGFLDDFIKIRKQRSLGLNKTAKLVGQLGATIAFAILALQFPNKYGLRPVSVNLSYVRDISAISFGVVGFVIFCYIAVSAWSNAVNFTDGLDGLAGGTSAMALAVYMVITYFQTTHDCTSATGLRANGCFYVRDPLDLALVAAAAMGACVGFLWWNAAPARIIMGDVGALGLGAALALLALATDTSLLLPLVCILNVIEIGSVALQMGSYKLFNKRRLFRMSPIHHHFELIGWPETTVVIRFWIVAGIGVAMALGLFYADFARQIGVA